MSLIEKLRMLLGDQSIELGSQVQSLWSGYGQIIRIHSLSSGARFIVKVVMPEGAGSHPRGWNTSASHQRKLRSYQVEANFYKDYAGLTDHKCKVPKLIASTDYQAGILLVMEDLDAIGFSGRKDRADWQTLRSCIKWLAHFHAKFLRQDDNLADGLWPTGTYWHLATRQDEWEAMPESEHKRHAKTIDQTLSSAKFKTLVHGDAKLANLCFQESGDQVAAVDFQYVGGGAGVKDLAYLAGSAMDDDELTEYGGAILQAYLTQLKSALDNYGKSLDWNELEAEIRYLYPIAWADFYRFLIGWNPQSWKICGYMQEMADVGVSSLQ